MPPRYWGRGAGARVSFTCLEAAGYAYTPQDYLFRPRTRPKLPTGGPTGLSMLVEIT